MNKLLFCIFIILLIYTFCDSVPLIEGDDIPCIADKYSIDRTNCPDVINVSLSEPDSCKDTNMIETSFKCCNFDLGEYVTNNSRTIMIDDPFTVNNKNNDTKNQLFKLNKFPLID